MDREETRGKFSIELDDDDIELQDNTHHSIGLDEDGDDLKPNNSVELDDDNDVDSFLDSFKDIKSLSKNESINLSFEELASEESLSEEDDLDFVNEHLSDELDNSVVTSLAKNSSSITKILNEKGIKPNKLSYNELIVIEQENALVLTQNTLAEYNESLGRAISGISNSLRVSNAPDSYNYLRDIDSSVIDILSTPVILETSKQVSLFVADKERAMTKEDTYKMIPSIKSFEGNRSSSEREILVNYMIECSKSRLKHNRAILQLNNEKENIISKYSKFLYSKLPTLSALNEIKGIGNNLESGNIPITEFTFTPRVEITNNGYNITCGKCGKVINTKYPILGISYVNEFVALINPCMCDNCKSYNIIKDYLAESIRDATATLYPKVKKDYDKVAARKNSRNSSNDVFNPDKHNLLIPSVKILCEQPQSVFVDERVSSESEVIIDLDWEKLKTNHMKMIEVFYRKSKSKQFEEHLGVKGIAKIISGTTTGYKLAKKRAIASLLHQLSTVNLVELTQSYIQGKNLLPRLYKDRELEFYRELSCNINSEKFISDEGELLNKELYLNKIDKFFAECEKLPNKRDILINTLLKYEDLFARVPLNSNQILDNDKEEFLSYEPLSKAIDRISDLMIIYNNCKLFINRFNPHKLSETTGNTDRDISYRMRYSNIMNPGEVSEFPICIRKYIEWFSIKFCNLLEIKEGQLPDKIGNFINIMNYPGMFMNDSDLLSDIAAMAENLCVGKYYSAIKLRNSIIQNRESFNNLNPDFITDYLKDIYDLIMNLPIVNDDKSKFDFYFGECNFKFELTEQEKESLVNLYVKKRFIPKTFQSEDFTGIFAEYDVMVDSEHRINTLNIFDEFVKENIVLLESLRHFYSTKDTNSVSVFYSLLKNLDKCNLNNFVKCFELNKDLTQLYLYEDFNYGGVTYERGKLFRNLLFKNSDISNIIIKDELETDDTLRLDLAPYKEDIKVEYEDNEEASEIIKDFFRGDVF